MPYPLEKGDFPLLIEGFFNEGLDQADEDDKPPAIFDKCVGARRRLRAIWRYCEIVQKLKAGKGNEQSIARVTADNSLVLSSFFQGSTPHLPVFQKLMAENWFGMLPDGKGGWTRRPTSSWQPLQSLGHWTGYYGNVELIMVEAMQRMLEVSLGLDHCTALPKGKSKKAIEERLRDDATRVWPVYLFLTCPQPWFGAWVTWQCHDAASAVRGQVTGLLQGPGHSRPITPSPVDRKADKKTIMLGGVERPNPYYLHGVETQSGNLKNSGYEGPYLEGNQVKGKAPVSATADQGMWLVTHENHDSAIVWSSFKPPTTANWAPGAIPTEAWELPPIAHYRCATLDQRADGGTKTPSANTLDGYFDTVVVSPASLDGGIPIP
jgi:hypothetical protein